jgi:hypothetical protein
MNRITQFTVRDRALSPAEAEIWILAGAETVTPTTALRGRLVGPTCPYSTTIEIAYPLRPIPKSPSDLSPLSHRFVVPEPSLWDPVAPFLYHATIELWQDGRCCDRRAFRHGFRDARIAADAVIWNGKSLNLSILDRPDLKETDLPRLRRDGVNTLVLPGSEEVLWTAAERLGFVVIGRALAPRMEWLELSKSPACLGWIVPPDAISEEWETWKSAVTQLRRWVGDESECLRFALTS